MSDSIETGGGSSAASQHSSEAPDHTHTEPADASYSDLHDNDGGDDGDDDDDCGDYDDGHHHHGSEHSHSHEHGACSGHHHGGGGGGGNYDAGSGYDEDDGTDDAFAPPGSSALRYMTLAQLRSCLKDGGAHLVGSNSSVAHTGQSTEADARAVVELLRSSPNQIMADLAESVDFAHAEPPRSFASLDDARRFRRALTGMITEAIHLLDVFDHFAAYGHDARTALAREEQQFSKIDWKMRAVLGDLRSKFVQREECIAANQDFLNELLRTQVRLLSRLLLQRLLANLKPLVLFLFSHLFALQGLTSWHLDFTRIRRLLPPGRRLPNGDKVRSALRQCARDWSSAGAVERAQTYDPLLAALEAAFPDVNTRGQRSVLVPGTGLSRLHYEIAQRGFGASACEFSYYMLLPAFYLLNKVERAEQWTIYPWVGGRGNLRKTADRVAPVKVRMMTCGASFLS
jgi:hypothetical protein